MKTILVFTAVIFSGFATLAQAEGTRATCTAEGRIVHREELPGIAGDEEKIRIQAKYPNALCIFMGGSEQAVATQQAGNSEVRLPVEAFEPEAGPSDLAAALAMISSGETGQLYPADLTRAMESFRASEGQLPTVAKVDDETAEKTINLTIGIYRHITPEDVLAHWKVMQQEGDILKHMTPTLTKVEDITMLSIENVPDNVADPLCKAASQVGSGCVAFY